MSEAKPIACVNCGHEMHLGMVAKAADQSRMRAGLSPMPGELMTAQVVGRWLDALAKLLVESGKSLGTNTVVLVEKIENGADPGSLNFHLLIARGPAAVARKKRMKAETTRREGLGA